MKNETKIIPVDFIFAVELKKIRREMKLNQSQFANVIGLNSASAISRIEKGQHRFSNQIEQAIIYWLQQTKLK